jgi:hypothetical protein
MDNATDNFPAELLHEDGTVKDARAALAALRYADGDPLIGDRATLLAAGLSAERIEEIRAAGQQPKPTSPPSPHEASRADANAALERQEQRAKDVRAARALLQERYGEIGVDVSSMDDRDVLKEAGLLTSEELTPQERKAAELEAYNQRVISDPAFAEAELHKRAVKDFAAAFPSIHPHVRVQRAKDLGISESEFDSIADDWRDRFTTRT